MSSLARFKKFWRRQGKADGNPDHGTANGVALDIMGEDVQELKDENKEKKEKPPQVPFLQLFRYSNKQERALILLASVASIIHGALLPMFTIIFGNVITSFSASALPTDIVGVILDRAKWFGVLAAVAFVVSFIQVFFFVRTAHSQCTRIRRKYFRALMSQEFAWYDSNDTGELTARVASDVDLIQSGVGDKVGNFLQYFFMFVVGFIVGFIFSWKLTLVILSTVPLLALGGMAFGKITAASTEESQSSYGEAGAIANEVLSSIRSVTAYGGQDAECDRYQEKLNKAYSTGVKKSHLMGLSMGLTMGIILCVYAIAFYYGSRLVRDPVNPLDVGDVVTVFFSVIMGAMAIGQAAPSLNSFAVARGAAPRIFEIIDRHSAIDPLSDEGKTLSRVEGNIEFKNVSFTYKGRSDRMILDNMNFTVPRGTTFALVGASGCGKSTTVGLIERFYDVLKGSVTLDGVDVKTLNVQWLRSQIGYVSQMPALFGVSVRENIALGAGLEPYMDPVTGKTSLRRKHVSEEEIIAAAKLANAHKFIMKLPDGYSTVLGVGNSQLSGGQKQRVAIARALIRNPKILLLDEATSALDAASERVVQEALERAQEGRTTIVIAHRLSTVKNADAIAVVEDGRIVEQGSHKDLINKPEGAYRRLVELQNIQEKKAKGKVGEEDERDDDSILKPQLTFEWDKARRTSTGVISRKKSTSIIKRLTMESTEEEEKPDIDKGLFRRTLRENLMDLPLTLVGALGAAGSGTVWPLTALLLSEMLTELGGPRRDDRIRFWTLMYVAVAGLALIANYVYLAFTGISGERLTRKTRMKAFRALLRQEIGFFDLEENQLGVLTTHLAIDSTLVKGLTGDTFGAAAQAIATILSGVIIAFAACWRVALSVLAIIPGVAIGGYFQMKMMTGFDSDSKKKYADSGSTATEAVSNIRTVTSLGIQDHFCGIYNEKVAIPLRNGQKGAYVTGIAFAFSEFCTFIIFLVAFYAGSKFTEDGFCDFEGVFKATTGLLFGAMTLGQVSIFMPDVASSRIAATKLYRLFDRVSKIDPSSDEGEKLTVCEGKVDLCKVEFEYPRRPDIPVLRGLTTTVRPTKTLALVGESGCGKSTVISLVERFYDPRIGEVQYDGKNLKKLNIQSARSHVSLVSQEPDLFNRTIRDNIAYGFSKAEGTIVTDSQIIEAAKAANAHDFIMGFPDGYDTLCGEKGSQLSGGQRQRIAIARSLVRKPRILLLDEATSALDAKSEKVVQDALDRAREGRTTIVIAHRLSTVRNADQICVVAKGRIVESGTHDELMAKNREYANLVKNQMTDVPDTGDKE